MTEKRRLDLVGSETQSVGIPPWLAFEMDLAEEQLPDASAILHNAAGVRLETGRVVDHDAGDGVYVRGARVVCETDGTSPAPPERGQNVSGTSPAPPERGQNVSGTSPAPPERGQNVSGVVVVPSRRMLAKGPLPRILRVESEGDRSNFAKVRAREQDIYVASCGAAKGLALPLKVVRAEFLGQGQGFVVYFASEERVVFRDLLSRVSELTGERIELRQVGLRDASKVVGGVGPCGLQLCCNTFLSEFAPITIKMAKDQGLGVNPQKLAGLCGRLLCCLVYEEAFYRAQRQLVPRQGDRVETDRGEGRVRDVDVLQMLVKVSLDSGETVTRPVAELSRKLPDVR